MKILKRILLGLLVIASLAGIGFVVWAELPLGPQAQALSALESDAQVTVTSADWITFQPAASHPTTGLVFYPGAHVDYRSYAPALRKVAAQGYLVVLLRVPLNLAIFGPNAAAPALAAYPEIQHWAVGGHSLGGVVAAQYAASNLGKVHGLVFWASYPPDDRLLHSTLQVASIYGTEDALATPQKINASIDWLPITTRYIQIDGGNHAQFGDYGPQPGDHPAAILPEEQWNQAAAATVEMLQSLAMP